MPLVPAKCPECGGNVVVDSEKDAWICDFCKTPFIVEKAINHFNTVNNVTNNITNNNQINADVVNVYESKNSEFIIKAGALTEYNGASMDVIVPDGVVMIGYDVFNNSNIRSIIIHDNVTQVGSFDNCIALEKVKLPTHLNGVAPSFKNCTSLKEIVLPEGIESIAEGGRTGFENCISLERVILPNSLKTIGTRAFSGCRSLKEIHIPENVAAIGEGAFADCINLKTVRLPNQLKTLNIGIFKCCMSLEEVNIPESINSIGGMAFYECKELRKIELPHSVETIGSEAFRNCERLKDLSLPAGLKTVCESAFAGCGSLEKINLYGQIAWGRTVFAECTNLKEVELDRNIVVVPKGFFGNCDKLEKINLDNVQIIEGEAFSLKSPIMKEIEGQFSIPAPNGESKRLRSRAEQPEYERRLAVWYFTERAEQCINNLSSDSSLCPFCSEDSLDWRGKCKNPKCGSFKMKPQDALSKMINRVKMGNCPSCNSKLIKASGRLGFDGKKYLDLVCSNQSGTCNLVNSKYWQDNKLND